MQEEKERIRHVFKRKLTLLIATVMMLQACGNNDQRDPDPDPLLSIQEVLPPTYSETWAAWSGDLDGMIERRMIRVVTTFGGYLYYYDNGAPRGVTWELANRLENTINKRLGNRNIRVFVVVIPLSRDQLIPALMQGHADIIAADLTMTDLRAEQVAFSRPLLKDINEVIVTGPNIDDITTIADLAKKRIHVRPSSSYYEHLQRMSQTMRDNQLKPPKIIELDELLESEDILDMISSGMIDITVMDDYKARFWAEAFPSVTVRDDLVINEGGSVAWMVRKDSSKLLAELNTFLRQFGRGTLIGNDTYNRYLSDANALRCSSTAADNDSLGIVADAFQKHGEQYDYDWLQLAAQGFQESKLRQDRRSTAGAVGIMQIKPSTAADPNVGIDDITTINGNVHAGTKYMRFLADRYFTDETIKPVDQWLLSLAAYNAGPARVINLRNEAADNGYDPNVWFDHVEIIAAKRIGRETVNYVSNIFKYYTGYQMAAANVSESREKFGDLLEACLE